MLLDDFEGELYERVSVKVETEKSGELAAATYVIKREQQNLLSNDLWDPQEFEKRHLQDFIENYKGFSGLRKQP